MNTTMYGKSRTRLMALLIASLLSVGLWVITAYQMHLARDTHLEMIERNLVSVVRSLHAHAIRTIQLADQAAVFIKREFSRDGLELDLNQLIEGRALTEDLFTLFTVVDAQANVALSTRPFEKVNLADREHIKVHFDKDTGKLFVGRPVVGRVSGVASIQFTRRINAPDGSFGGVVVVSMDPFYFTNMYGSLGLGPKSIISLLRDDGIMLVRRTDSDQSIGIDVSNGPVFKKIINSGSDFGVFQATSQLDDTERLFAFQRLDDFPLTVAVGVNLDEELAPFYETRSHIYLLVTLLTISIYGFAFAVARFIGKVHDSRLAAIQASRSKSEFLSNVSHELRTPINGILGYAELLELQEKDPEKSSFLRSIQQSGTHLLSLVNTLLALNRIEKGQLELDLKPESLDGVLDEAIATHSQNARTKGLSLTLHKESSLPKTFVCDRVRLLQILHNLLHNAIKFSSHGQISVHAGMQDGLVEIRVRDTGPGIEPSNLSSVFERFYKGDSDSVGAQDGFGLGLAIVKQLTELMHGSISVSSKPGQGSTFTVRLPQLQSANDASKNESGPGSA